MSSSCPSYDPPQKEWARRAHFVKPVKCGALSIATSLRGMASAALLVGPWRECFELAWEAFRAGTIPVGAVVADESGEIVARGRNHIFEETAPPGQLAGTYLAHAELNALAGLPLVPPRDGRGPFEEHTLYTTLEPCALCVGAALMIMVGEIRYASTDHYGGGRELRLDNPHTARKPL